jgi:2-polyprenyl-6-methoxyphenol hydroxylase-like FAD-dependent oxidoreductase
MALWPDPRKRAIIGGGIGGLAAALSLLRAGLDAYVYERAKKLPRRPLRSGPHGERASAGEIASSAAATAVNTGRRCVAGNCADCHTSYRSEAC